MRPQNKIISLSAAFLFATGFTANALDNDTLFLTPDTLGNSFTLELNNVQLTNEADSFSVLIRREYIGKDRKTYITFHSDKVISNGEIIARNLPNDGRAHNYVFARRGITTTIFRDGIQFATTPSEVLTEIPISTSLRALPYEYSVMGISKLAAGCTADTLSTLEFIEPDEAQGETRIGEMLGGTNLVTDPYLNTGFNGEGLNAADRTFVTNAALLGGWGTEAEMSPDSYSGPYCVRLSGQAFTNGNATTGASLTIPARLTSGTDNPNMASLLFLVDGATALMEELEKFMRVFNVFDGNSEEALTQARAFWKNCKASGNECHYWKQSPSGAWSEVV